MRNIHFLLFCLAFLVSLASQLSADAGEPLVREDDRLVLVGPTMIERMQRFSYLDTHLAIRSGGQLETRNLGWSGDTVFGISRAVFGTQEQGFGRLLNDIVQAEPTVVLLAYGQNEAHAGENGAESFAKQYTVLAQSIKDKTGARLIFLQPRKVEWLGTPYPAPAAWNRDIQQYRAVIREIAASLDAPVIESSATDSWTLTSNGLHPTPAGYWKYAEWLADQLLGGPRPANVTAVKLAGDQRSFSAPRPIPGPAEPSGDAAGPAAATSRLKITGLPPGKYRLVEGENTLASATAEQWAHGHAIRDTGAANIVEQVRQLAIAKNELYFHRYRPQNETYLFLFRKHEQGNNAVEIPQFEPLVADVEQKIRDLVKPQLIQLRLVREP